MSVQQVNRVKRTYRAQTTHAVKNKQTPARRERRKTEDFTNISVHLLCRSIKMIQPVPKWLTIEDSTEVSLEYGTALLNYGSQALPKYEHADEYVSTILSQDTIRYLR